MYTPTIAMGVGDERMDMSTSNHMLFSRMLGAMVFCAFLILTPRAWVEPDHHAATEEVPVNVLETPSGCLWCDPAPAADCDDEQGSKATSARPWLNPDESPMPLAPCKSAAPATVPHS